jgi:3-oxoacyl-[acyl-carrier protein] reductase
VPADQLDGRVIALTGAGGGLGLLTAEVLLTAGARVIANHRSPSNELRALADRFAGRLTLVPGDVGDESTASALVAAAQGLGRLDALILNAAIAKDQALVRMSAQDWDEVMRVNLRGPFLATKHALKMMMRRRYGRIIYISSLSAVVGNAGQAGYAASKAALHGLSNVVAQEYARYNIRSVVLAPGLLDTGLGAAVGADIRKQKSERQLLGIGDPRSIARTIAFLAGPDADFINGTVINANGGLIY